MHRYTLVVISLLVLSACNGLRARRFGGVKLKPRDRAAAHEVVTYPGHGGAFTMLKNQITRDLANSDCTQAFTECTAPDEEGEAVSTVVRKGCEATLETCRDEVKADEPAESDFVCLLPPTQAARDFETKSTVKVKSGTQIDIDATNSITRRIVQLHAQTEATLALQHSLANACFMYVNRAFGPPGLSSTHTNYVKFVMGILNKFKDSHVLLSADPSAAEKAKEIEKKAAELDAANKKKEAEAKKAKECKAQEAALQKCNKANLDDPKKCADVRSKWMKDCPEPPPAATK